ncbi:MAG: phospholipase/Carboxylesterase [Gemmatimonadetes bacterium]|nr:phospholipase/Carboxylesterase [Gemmatimonadota bacterium]
MSDVLSGYTYRWEPGDDDKPVLLLLHGTGGDENDLVPLGDLLAPGAAILSPRGNVSENGAPRFFRRLAEGVFDMPDLHARTAQLAEFIRESAGKHEFDVSRVVAVGFSNGANIAASVMLAQPGSLQRGILFRAMVPFEPPQPAQLAGSRVFLGQGRTDPMMPPASAERLAGIFREGGASVTLAWQPAGHVLTRADVELAKEWLKDDDSR